MGEIFFAPMPRRGELPPSIRLWAVAKTINLRVARPNLLTPEFFFYNTDMQDLISLFFYQNYKQTVIL
jgi:hypothetical protein